MPGSRPKIALERMFNQVLIVGLALVLISARAEGARRGLVAGDSATVFDVTKNGATGDGKTDCTQAFMDTWITACKSPGPATVLVPQGNYLLGEVFFSGPCTGSMTLELQGTLLGTTDLSEFVNGQWITFQRIDNLLVTGSGTFNGQGEQVWHFSDCKGKAICNSLLPPSIVFSQVNNSVMQQVNMVDSKGFHMKINDLSNFTVQNVNITARWDSPNTDGIHVSRSDQVVIKDSTIGTGDDCISIGEGSTNLNVSGIFCGPGHGISVGSLGYRQTDQDVSGITVTNCTLTNTTNGARIKTWHESPPLKATSIIFEDLVMNMVKNPIYIDQHYGSKGKNGASNVKISDIHFRNIRGTTISNNVVTFLCSSTVPCEGIEVAEIDIALVGITKNLTIASVCDHAQATFSGKITPLRCTSS